MKHALDVAVMLDTIAHDEHLGMKELIPVKITIIVVILSGSYPIPSDLQLEFLITPS